METVADICCIMAIPATTKSSSWGQENAIANGDYNTGAIITTTDSTTTSSSKSILHRFKCVSFDLQPSVQEVMSRHDFSAEEIDLAWYCRLELEAMAAVAMDPSHDYQQLENDKAGTMRGLEKYSTAGSTRLEIHRVQVVAAVLREQQRQRQLLEQQQNNKSLLRNRDILLAEASIKLSQECQELANMQGYNDEIQAYAGDAAAHTDVVEIPKPGLFEGFAKQVRALSDLAFLESHQGKGRKKQ